MWELDSGKLKFRAGLEMNKSTIAWQYLLVTCLLVGQTSFLFDGKM